MIRLYKVRIKKVPFGKSDIPWMISSFFSTPFYITSIIASLVLAGVVIILGIFLIRNPFFQSLALMLTGLLLISLSPFRRLLTRDYQKAMALSNRGNFEAAINAFDEVAKKYRARPALKYVLRIFQSVDAYNPDINAMVNAGITAAVLDKDIEAQERFDKVLEICPDHILAWHYLGEINAEGGDVTTAMHCFEKALEICPSFHYTKIVQAAWLYAYDRASAAGKLLATVPSKKKKPFAIISCFAAAFALAEDRVDDARNHIQQALKIEPVPKLCKEMCKAVFPDLYKPEL